MRNSLISLFALVTVVLAQDEPFRPQFHFTPEKNWMNDPNGMVFFEGEWHLKPLAIDACKIDFSLVYEFDTRLVARLAGPVP